MSNINRIVCIQSVLKYKMFLKIINETYSDVHVLASLSSLEKKMECMSKSKVTVVFLDNSFVSEVNSNLQVMLGFDNCICISLYEDKADFLCEESFIYDILSCSKLPAVKFFFNRLEKDLNYRLQLLTATYEARESYRIGQKLAAEKDVNVLLELILYASMKMTGADAGTLYIVVNHIDSGEEQWSYYKKKDSNKHLKFVISKNNSVDLELQSTTIPILDDSIVGHTVINGRPVRIEDVYNLPQSFQYKFSSKFDDLTGYRTKSMLAIPMKDQQNRILGVIQLINKKVNGEILPFAFKDEAIIYALAGQASIALENNILYKEMENLIDDYRQTINEEVNKQKQTDEEINKLLSAIEHSPITVIITDIDGKIQYVNPKFTELTGYSCKEVIGKTPRILNSKYYSKKFYEQFWDKILSGEEWRGEFRNKKKNGELYWESASISSIKDRSGKIKYLMAIKEDITEKRQIALELKEKNSELKDAISKLQSAQSHLIQKEKMAGIGHLAAGMAHEINNPLGFIISNTQVLEKYSLKLRELLILYKTFVKNNADFKTKVQFEEYENIKRFEEETNLDFVLDDLLELFNDTNSGLKRVKEIVNALWRLSTTEQINTSEDYDLNRGIRTSITMLNHEIGKHINLNEELGDIPKIKASSGEINQSLLNLIMNAIQAVKEKHDSDKGEINIRTYYKNKIIFCEIEDNGIGIEKENINDIFNPFYTTKPEGQGIGLGLSTVYEAIVKGHNGEIKVDSKKGTGTKFTLKIPV